MAQIIKSQNELNPCYGLIAKSLGFETIAEQRMAIQHYAAKNDLLICDYLEFEPTLNTSVEMLLKSASSLGSVTFIVNRLSLLPSSINSLERLLSFCSKLTAYGSTFVSIQDQLDTDQNAQVFISSLDKAWPEFKRSRKSANAKASMAKAKNRNSVLGRKKIRNDALIYELHNQGLTIREIALKIGLSRAAVHQSLKSSSSFDRKQERLTPEV